MLAALGGSYRMLRVKLVGSGNIDGVDVGTRAHRFNAGKSLASVLFAKFCQRIGARVRRCRDFHIGQREDRRQDLRARHAEPCHAKTKELTQTRVLASASRSLAYWRQLLLVGIISETTRK